MASAEDRKKLKLWTPEFRGSFVHLNRPRVQKSDDGTEKKHYQITIVLPKDAPFWKELAEKIKGAARVKWDGVVPEKLKSPIRNGDAEDAPEGMKGCYYVRAEAREEEKPGIMMRAEDGTLVPVVDPAEIYSGAYYIVTIRPWAWFHQNTNKKGVSLNLDNVLKTRDGEPFSARAKAADDFADYVDGGAEGEDGSGDDLLG